MADLVTATLVAVGCVLLAAPAGLVWSALSPRLTVRLGPDGPSPVGVEGKALVGADGSFLAVILVAGVLTGGLAWLLARRAGPWTVLGLLVGGLVAAKTAGLVGVMPGRAHVRALLHDPHASGVVELYLRLRAPWSVVGWPVAALVTFVTAALRRPEELD